MNIKESHSRFLIPLFLFTIIFGLVIDQYFQPMGQYGVNIWVWLLFSSLVYFSDTKERTQVLICLVLATIGELVLSEWWQMYSYREGSIPLFVPPGHVLLYTMGLWLAKRVLSIVWLMVLFLFIPYAFYTYIYNIDRVSSFLFLVFIVLLFQKKNRSLFSVMFLMSLAMELLGTYLGNWQWVKEFRFIGISMSQTNPPFAAGVFYCLLDYLVHFFMSRFKKNGSLYSGVSSFKI